MHGDAGGRMPPCPGRAMAETRRSARRLRAAFALTIACLVALSVVAVGGETVALRTQVTGSYDAKIGTWASPTPTPTSDATPTPTPDPGPTAAPPPTPTDSACPIGLFSYGKSGASGYPMLAVRVWARAPLPAGCGLSFSLDAYTTQGPDASSTGTALLVDHASIMLDASQPSGTLTVAQPPCFGRTDFYAGTSVPQPLLAWSSGGQACADALGAGVPGGDAAPTASPDPTTAPSPTSAPDAGSSATPTDSSAPDATPIPSQSPDPMPSPTAQPTAVPPPTAPDNPSPSATPAS